MEENARILEVAAASRGRLVALHRVDPALGDAAAVAADARSALEAGARGLKWHPRAEAFGMHHPAAAASAAVADELGVPILIHAGRGMPHLGEGVVDLARTYPGATFMLAHAAISDIAWIMEATRDLPNVVFDTSWWRPFDVAVLLTRARPGRLLFGSDPPYGSVTTGMQITARVARACGFADVAMRSLMGEAAGELLQIDSVATGGDQRAAWGERRLPEDDADMRRATGYIEAAMLLTLGRASAAESLELARHALRVPGSHEHADAAAVLRAALGVVGELQARPPEDDRVGATMGIPVHLHEAVRLLVCTLAHAATPAIPVAGAGLLA